MFMGQAVDVHLASPRRLEWRREEARWEDGQVPVDTGFSSEEGGDPLERFDLKHDMIFFKNCDKIYLT